MTEDKTLLQPMEDKLYNCWRGMRSRTRYLNKSKYYRGKTIEMSREWYYDYQAFRTWSLENGFNGVKRLRRIRKGWGFYPENCEWYLPKTKDGEVIGGD